jgi:hypothetical protein
MEKQHSEYRTAMIDMRKFEPSTQPPVICFVCVGFSSFGGLDVKENVTAGPMCVCDSNWIKVKTHLKKMKTKKLLTI